eukprot:SM000163S02296  [mRNA]  locus=s163:21027:21660:+ [translate_table: standard]
MQIFVKTRELLSVALPAAVRGRPLACVARTGGACRLRVLGRGLCLALVRKKKTYTKPKKLKHKKKKVKLAVLQYYKVDESGKVHRLRKECPNPQCGAGTFMANHFDRHYCGKCGLTYMYGTGGD